MGTNASIIRRFIEDVLNDGNIEATWRYFHENVVEQVPLPGQGPGLVGLMDVLRGFRVAFPDMHWTVEEQIEEGDKVVTRFVWTGTHRAEFLGVPGTGRLVSVWGVVIDRFVDGRVIETRIIMDVPTLMTQMIGGDEDGGISA